MDGRKYQLINSVVLAEVERTLYAKGKGYQHTATQTLSLVRVCNTKKTLPPSLCA
jgi:hypothetical protein